MLERLRELIGKCGLSDQVSIDDNFNVVFKENIAKVICENDT